MSKTSVTRILPDETATAALGAELSLVARRGDVVLLDGDLGAGKTTLARGFIRAVHADDTSIEVPSPSFPILQTYEEARLPVAHLDLYRVRAAGELHELGIDDLRDRHVLLVEWPALLSPRSCRPTASTVRLVHDGGGRRAELVGEGNWASRAAAPRVGAHVPRVRRMEGCRSAATSRATLRRAATSGFAASDRCAILMDMPARADGPPVRDGKPYSAIAHLAEDVRSVVAVTDALLARGLSAARIYDRDVEGGFLVIEDLGDGVYGRMLRTQRRHVRGDDHGRDPVGRHGGNGMAAQHTASRRQLV